MRLPAVFVYVIILIVKNKSKILKEYLHTNKVVISYRHIREGKLYVYIGGFV